MMTTDQSMYLRLCNRVTEVITLLQQTQVEAEEIFISDEETVANAIVLIKEDAVEQKE